MAENNDEVSLEYSTNNQSENSPDEIINSVETETIKPIQEIENMEVHHHTHDPAVPHHKKNWKSYFWEFLMLFLAVFCGFLAEWRLEHVIEHSREKEFMESMLTDIKTDSSNLANMKSRFVDVSVHIDSLIPLLKENETIENNATKVYKYQVYLNLYMKWTYSDRTIDQLKNSGNFRLIRKKNVSDAISKYDGYVRNFIDDMQKNLVQKQFQDIASTSNDIFKSSVFREYYKSGQFSPHEIKLPDAPYFLINDKTFLQKFINKLDQYAVSLEWFNVNIDDALKQNKQLDSLIRKEYNLDE